MKYEQFKEIMEYLLNNGTYYILEKGKESYPHITKFNKYSLNKIQIHILSNDEWSIGIFDNFNNFYKTIENFKFNYTELVKSIYRESLKELDKLEDWFK